MLFPMKAIGEGRLSPEDLESDRKNCIHYEETGLGKKALFLPFLGIGRRAYIPLSSIDRVYKRLCVSKGFFEEGKIYGSLSYLVICFEGREKAFRFLREENLDALLDAFRVKTDIPVGKNN